MICIDDNMLLCCKCVSETSCHVGHQIEDLSQCLELLTTELAKVKPKEELQCVRVGQDEKTKEMRGKCLKTLRGHSSSV